jgi:DNA-directed RNA polymerase subunit RPC12/RpoP
MKYFIPIDRSTIRKNPDYNPSGSCEFVPGLIDIRIKGKFPVPDYIKPYIEVTDWEFPCEKGSEYDAVAVYKIPDNIVDKMQGDPRILSMDISHEVIDVTTLPGPKYLYDYKDIWIRCNECKEKFNWRDLKEQEVDDETYSDKVCPYCGELECCELEFENIENLKDMKRKLYYTEISVHNVNWEDDQELQVDVLMEFKASGNFDEVSDEDITPIIRDAIIESKDIQTGVEVPLTDAEKNKPMESVLEQIYDEYGIPVQILRSAYEICGSYDLIIQVAAEITAEKGAVFSSDFIERIKHKD